MFHLSGGPHQGIYQLLSTKTAYASSMMHAGSAGSLAKASF